MLVSDQLREQFVEVYPSYVRAQVDLLGLDIPHDWEEAIDQGTIWLEDALGGEASDYAAFLAHHALFELYMLRRYAAKIDYELTLHQGAELEGKDAAYKQKLSAATGVEYPQVSYLDDVDPFFYCANYLRAWMLQAQMAEVLKTKFGVRWCARSADQKSHAALAGMRAIPAGLVEKVQCGRICVCCRDRSRHVPTVGGALFSGLTTNLVLVCHSGERRNPEPMR